MTTITTRTGLTHEVRRDVDACGELLSGPDGQPLVRGGRNLTCEREAAGLVIDLSAARRGIVSACYCDRHGGEERARAELASDWLLCAPPSVGDREAVQRAGTFCLTSREAYVVVRPEGPRWLAWIGLGSHLLQVRNTRAQPKLRLSGKPETKTSGRGGKPRVRGAMAFTSRDEALAAAVDEWRANLRAAIRAITNARGGTLAWGLPVEPLDEPIVLEPREGETAWDVVARSPRRGAMSGVRPSGEAV